MCERGTRECGEGSPQPVESRGKAPVGNPGDFVPRIRPHKLKLFVDKRLNFDVLGGKKLVI